MVVNVRCVHVSIYEEGGPSTKCLQSCFRSVKSVWRKSDVIVLSKSAAGRKTSSSWKGEGSRAGPLRVSLRGRTSHGSQRELCTCQHVERGRTVYSSFPVLLAFDGMNVRV